MFSSIIKGLIGFLYPPFCICCGKSINTSFEKVCNNCWEGLQKIDGYRPPKKVYVNYLEDAISCFVFDTTLKKLIHFMKYNKFKSIGFRLGFLAGEEIRSNLSWLMSYDLLIPIPLNSVKKRERSYNQSELIANGISAVTGLPVNNKLLVRKKYTISQTNLDLHERKTNVEDAFKVEKEKHSIENKNIILVDDVITTGATLNFAAKELVESGAEKVIGFAVASPLML